MPTTTTTASETPTAPHDCGLCDAPLQFDGMSGGHATYLCTGSDCDSWHISADCCDPVAVTV